MTKHTDTPRVDAVATPFLGVQFVSADFARTLERELAQTSARVETLEGALGKLVRHHDDYARRGLNKYKSGSPVDRLWKSAKAALAKH